MRVASSFSAMSWLLVCWWSGGLFLRDGERGGPWPTDADVVFGLVAPDPGRKVCELDRSRGRCPIRHPPWGRRHLTAEDVASPRHCRLGQPGVTQYDPAHFSED